MSKILIVLQKSWIPIFMVLLLLMFGIPTPVAGSETDQNAAGFFSDYVHNYDTSGTFLSGWGTRGSGDGQFLHIHGIAVDSSGNVYTTDEDRGIVQKFDSNGNFIAKWGSKGSGDGQFGSKVEDITVDSLGNVYAVDSGHNRIQKFDGDGTFITKWGSKGSGDGQFNRPWGVAVDSSGNVYVTDKNNYRIQKFDSNGNFITKWGSKGSDDGQFDSTSGIAADRSDGYVFVADETLSVVQKFDSNGNFIAKWGSKGSGDGQFKNPHGVAIDFSGNVYIADTENQRIQKFSSSGEFIQTIGTTGTGSGQLIFPLDLAIGLSESNNTLYATDQKLQHPEKYLIQKIISELNINTNAKLLEYYTFVFKWGSEGTSGGQFLQPADIDFDSNGNPYVVDQDRRDIQKFTRDGRFLSTLDFGPVANGTSLAPYSISFDSDNSLYVVDRDNSLVLKIDTDGAVIKSVHQPGGDSGRQFSHPSDIMVVPDSGSVYVVDTGNDRIVELDKNLDIVQEWGTRGSGPGQFMEPSSIAYDSKGDLYVTDLKNPRIQKFDSAGNFIMQWGSPGVDYGEFTPPVGNVAVDVGEDSVWVVDGMSNPRVQKFSNIGIFLTASGSSQCVIEGDIRTNDSRMSYPHICDGAFSEPKHVGIDPISRNLYVVDSGNKRIQVFSAIPTILQTTDPNLFSALMTGSEVVPMAITQSSGLAYFEIQASGPQLTLKFNATFRGVDNIESVHLHFAGDGENGPVVVDLYPIDNSDLSISNDGNEISLQRSITSSMLSGPLAGKTMSDLISVISGRNVYVDIHTSMHTSGEIRGQISDAIKQTRPSSPNDGILCPAIINHPCVKTETVVTGLKFPTGMAFLSRDDILIIEKNEGTVRRVIQGNLLEEPLLKINIASGNEQGLLGIAIARSDSLSTDQDPSISEKDKNTFVFLYYTESDQPGGTPIGNRLYRYELVDSALVNGKLLLDLPAGPSASHNGGPITIGPDNHVYLMVGNMNSPVDKNLVNETLVQNVKGAPFPDGRGGILRVTLDGKPVESGILGSEFPLNLYYAYGIRNSFGLGFDPLTGNLWDTENGPDCCDEINLVEPGFNSGWRAVQGLSISNPSFTLQSLVDFDGNGVYSDPELVWQETVAPTSITFLKSARFGEEYQNDMLVGTFRGFLLHFDLDENRTGLMLDGSPLSDKVATNYGEFDSAVFASHLGIITDLEEGQDGYLYILSYNKGALFKVLPSIEHGGFLNANQETPEQIGSQLNHVLKFSNNGTFLSGWGTRGSGDGQFLHIHGIAVDSSGNVYTTDEDRGIVQKFDSNGNFIAKWGSKGSGDGQFGSKVEDITVDSLGNVYVVDYDLNRIQKFDSNGNFIAKWGSKGSGDGQFNRPWGVAVDSSGNVYVTDKNNYRIQKFDSNGNFITKWGSKGSGDGQFVHLHAIAIDTDDQVYVSDARENSVISKFSSDGTFITKWGSFGKGIGEFNEHHGIAFDSLGNVLVVDSGNQRIQIFSSDGNFIKEWDMGNGYPFILPHDIAIDSHGNVFLSEMGEVHSELSIVRRTLVDYRGQEFGIIPPVTLTPPIHQGKTVNEMITTNGKIGVMIGWGVDELRSGQELSIRLDFFDPEGNDLDADVLYDLRVINPADNTIGFMTERSIAEDGSGVTTVQFQEAEDYRLEIEVIGLVRDNMPIDTSRNGIAVGVVVVPEFPLGITVLMALSIISLVAPLTIKKFTQYF